MMGALGMGAIAACVGDSNIPVVVTGAALTGHGQRETVRDDFEKFEDARNAAKIGIFAIGEHGT